ncbi:Response regulator PleD [BD1-7 clade bacterium]|uniref:Response regulator PleD n=1 Tax=BD1-7 clade bacterium TaxID=2029982 RepID=A0A5S9PW40_9GAMM|nr:Response regulator PleD [BD1-7 clade bacterium]CAA0109615.1 Response regulator PleD [BD1-7 clade bacterium]
MTALPEENLRILIADDSNTDRMVLEAIIRKQGHEPILACDGIEAVAAFETEAPDIILLDALMPNMDGFETARYIKSNSDDRFIPIIFLTSLSEADSLAQCLEAGGDDFLTKPYNHVILKAKINAFRRMLMMHVTLQHQRDQIAANNLRLIQEQEIAKRTFDKVAHEGCLQVSNIQYRLSPMAVFNGDVLLAAPRPNGNLSVLLGDFTGHGLAAAIGAMPMSQTFYSMVAKGFCVRDVVIEINRKLKEILPVGIFCCATVVEIDFRCQLAEFWSGGMPDTFIRYNESGEYHTLKACHVPLGILSADRFSAETTAVQLAKGDRIYLWTDGIPEATNADGDMFGYDRLHRIFSEHDEKDDLFQHIMSTVDEFVGDTAPDDDLSAAEICLVNYETFAENQPKFQRYETFQPLDCQVDYRIEPDSLRHFDPLPFLQRHVHEIPALRSRSGDLLAILSELYSNALEHGVLGLDSVLKSSATGFAKYYEQRQTRLKTLSEGYILISIACRGDAAEGYFTVSITDSGDGFDTEKLIRRLDDTNSHPYSGRGIALVNSLADELRFNAKGNQVTASLRWPMKSDCRNG